MSDRRSFDAGEHPASATLLLYLESELDERAAARVSAHLRDCWLCQTTCGQMRDARSRFVEYWQDVLVPGVTVEPEQKALARRRLRERLLEEHPAPRRKPYGWLAGLTSAAAIGLLLFLPMAAPPVMSAAKFLGRVESVSRRSLEPPPGFRIRQKFAIRYGAYTAQRTILRGGSGAVKDDAQPDDDTVRSLAVAGIDWRDPVNPADFIAWRNAHTVESDQVMESPESITLKTTLRHNPAVRAVSLTVSRVNWRPVSRRAEFVDGPAVEVAEVSFEMEPVAGPAIATARVSQPAETVEAQPAPMIVPTLEEAELTAREVAHQAAAGTDEEPEIWEQDGRIHLRFWSTGPVRDEVRKRLEADPRIHEEDMEQSGSQQAARELSAAYVTAPPLAQALTEQLGGFPRATEYLNHIRDAHLRVVSECAALTRLAERYTAGRFAILNAGQRRRVDALAASYRERLRTASDEYLALLTPVLDQMAESRGVAAAPQPDPPGCMPWRQAAGALQSDAQHLQQNLRLLFVQQQVDEPVVLDATELLRAAAQARAALIADRNGLCPRADPPTR